MEIQIRLVSLIQELLIFQQEALNSQEEGYYEVYTEGVRKKTSSFWPFLDL